MAKKPLIETNPYLKDSKPRKAMIRLAVLSSTAVEGVRLTADDLRPRNRPTKKKAPARPRNSRRVKRQS